MGGLTIAPGGRGVGGRGRARMPPEGARGGDGLPCRALCFVQQSMLALKAPEHKFGPEKVFSTESFPPQMCSQNDQHDVGIISRRICWGPPPPEGKENRERIIVGVRSPCQEHDPADAHPSALKSVLGSPNPRTDSDCASGCPWSTAQANSPSPGRPTPRSSQTGQVIRGLR